MLPVPARTRNKLKWRLLQLLSYAGKKIMNEENVSKIVIMVDTGTGIIYIHQYYFISPCLGHWTLYLYSCG